jgi:hypothetical protein
MRLERVEAGVDGIRDNRIAWAGDLAAPTATSIHTCDLGEA